VSASAVSGISSIAPTTTAIESGRISAHHPPAKRRIQRGTPAAGSATRLAWAEIRTASAAMKRAVIA
jgi:hypothetical protein